MKRYTRAALCIAVTLALLLVSALVTLNRTVVYGCRGSVFDNGDSDLIYNDGKKYSAILVLGAGLQRDGSPSHMLEDRLKAAVELYRLGVSDTVIVSGDNSGEDYDEVSAMEKYCLDNGIPKEAIVRDDIGFSTYESVYNAVVTMGYTDIIIVTQKYHLYRAVYTAKQMGATADGYGADYRTYRGQPIRDLREYFARVKDLIKVNISP